MTQVRGDFRHRAGRSLASLATAVLWVGALTAIVGGPVTTAREEPRAPAAFDPSDVYFQGWLLSKDAEKLREEEKYAEALEKLRRARELFDTIARTFPEWRKDMVERRRTKTHDLIASVAPEALAEREAKAEATAELEGGARRGGSTDGGGARELEVDFPEAPIPPARRIETLESRRIAELERELERLQQRANRANADRRERDTDLAVAELQRTRKELDRLRRNSAEEPVREELAALARRINSLEAEKAVMGRALESSRGETREARAQIDALQQERGRLMQQVAKLEQKVANAERNLELERRTANEVVAGQRKQIQQFQSRLEEKDRELSAAHGKIRSLESELEEVRASFQDLEAERDELLRERDQMAALLKLNEAGQLQEVIDQNMALDRQLRESRERFEILKEDNDATKAELLEAKRDLATSKLRIREFRREKNAQQARLEALQKRLRQEERELAANESADPAEAEMLRAIIRKQIKIQEKRREASDLLIETLAEKAREDEQIDRALTLFRGAELNLTPEELRIIDGEEVDGVIISPFARPRDEVARNVAELRAELEPFERAGTRAYLNGRLRAAREAFDMIVDRNPGDVGAMCRLALVEFKLGRLSEAIETFRRATELEPRNPYALRMLGHTLGKNGEYEDARRALERSIELAPNHAESHLLLGNTLYQLDDFAASEQAFETALACEPTNAEAYYNLAVLLARTDRKERGLERYREALSHGAAPNLILEKRLGRN
jgi:Flp pilus assembly protein TadD